MLTMYQVDHLFIVVGENPLPCLVAGRLLLKQDGIIHLVYSVPEKGDNKYANGLCNVLGARKREAVPLRHERDARCAYDEVQKKLNSIDAKATVGLHYTGGTKVMAVHAYRAIIDARPDAVCSYLDPNRLEICIEQHGSLVKTEKLLAATVSEQIGLRLNDLWQIHGLTPMQPGDKDYSQRDTPAFLKAPQLIGMHMADEQWDEERKAIEHLANSDDIATLPPDIAQAIQEEHPEIRTMGNLRGYLGSRARNWLSGGDWLEDAVLGALRTMANKLCLTVDEMACSVIMKDPLTGKKYFEVDVVALRGYQLFVFSCTVSRETDACKAKLFEVAHRAVQLGGSEARYALVCGHDNSDKLKQKIGDTLSPSTFTVFDRHSLGDLTRAIENWILTVDREAQ